MMDYWMSFTMKFGQLKIISRVGKLRLFIGICALCMAPVSCIGPIAPENFAKEISGGYTVVAKLQTTGYAQDVVVADSFAYVSQGQCGVAIVNVSDPQNPRLFSELLYEIPGYSAKVAYVKNNSGAEVVYSADGPNGVASIDVIDKRNPTVPRSSAQFKPAKGLFVYKNFLFCSDSTQGIGIGDISDPKFPEAVQSIKVPGYAKGVCVSLDSVYLLCAVGEEGFVMENISRLVTGTEIPDTLSGRLDLPGLAEDIAIKPNTKYAFLACGPAGLQIVDYADTANIKVAGTFATGGYAREVCVVGDRAYLATEKNGVQIIDISNVASPKRIGLVKTKYAALGITVSNGYIYAADRYEGLIVIKIP
jgi:hypothetical protein